MMQARALKTTKRHIMFLKAVERGIIVPHRPWFTLLPNMYVTAVLRWNPGTSIALAAHDS